MLRITGSVWAAMTAKRIFCGSVEERGAERCAQCGELLHPFPKPTYWMQYPLPTKLIVDGESVCREDLRPSCLPNYLAKHPTPLELLDPPQRKARNIEGDMIKEQAAEIKKSADRGELARRLADWPTSADTGYRDAGSVSWESCFAGRKPPVDLKKFRVRLQKELDTAEAALARDCQVYDDYRVQGLDKISDYDLAVSGWPQLSATDRAWKAIEQALWLKHNHTTYNRSLVSSIKIKLAELDGLLGETNKGDTAVKPPRTIPPGHEFIDVWLTQQQAFVARKWAGGSKKTGSLSGTLERVQVLLPAHQAYQVKTWAMASMSKVERLEIAPDETRFEVESIHQRDKWGHPRVRVYLTPRYEVGVGWTVGWFCHADQAVDEYIVGHPTPADYPWHRPGQSAPSGERLIAMASAARAVKIVLEQMKSYVEKDCQKIIQFIQDRLEAYAMEWLQFPLGVEPIFHKGQKCIVVQSSSFIPTWRAGTRVIVVSSHPKTRNCFVYEDRPITYKTNRQGRKIVDYDPVCFQTVMSWDKLEPVW